MASRVSARGSGLGNGLSSCRIGARISPSSSRAVDEAGADAAHVLQLAVFVGYAEDQRADAAGCRQCPGRHPAMTTEERRHQGLPGP
jgi:hypothetical protein